MSRVGPDSSLNLLPGWESSPADSVASVALDDMPLLDLSSSGPLPVELGDLDSPAAPTLPAQRRAASTPAHAGEKRAKSIWLDGETLMCACPDCHVPMSIRVWLMVADCWNCGTSIELTQEQEREVERLLRQREQVRKEPVRQSPAQKAPVKKTAPAAKRTSPAPTPPAPRPTPQPSAPQQRPRQEPARRQPVTHPAKQPKTDQRRVAAASKPIGVHAKIKKMARLGAVQVFLHDFFKDMPAWLISLVVHLALLTLLGMLYFEEENHDPLITISSSVSRHVREGGEVKVTAATDDARFDLPVPPKNKPKNEQQERALLEADQQARELRIDPNTPDPQLPELSRVKAMLASSDAHRASLAARDPRLRVEMIKQEGGTTLTEAAVSRGLHWMARHQNPDGSWSLHAFHNTPECKGRCNGRGGLRSDSAATSLCLLPYLGAGQSHLTGRYKDMVAHGLRWLMDHQKPDGDLRADSQGNSGMYAHGQGAIVLSEAYGLTQDEMLRDPAQRAVNFIVAAQHSGGGWRYKPREPGDTSVLGWQLMALQSARSAGLEVPDNVLENAGHYLDSVQSDGGAQYAYVRKQKPTPTMSSEGLLCRMYLGWRLDQPGLDKGVRLLSKNLPSDKHPNIYYWYYGTQVLHHAGGAPWKQWNQRMRDVLVESQDKSGHAAGSWAPRGEHSNQGGRIYMTSLAVTTLEVYYRHAPIFRKLKLR